MAQTIYKQASSSGSSGTGGGLAAMGQAEKMSQAEVIAKLQSDPLFALGFATDNNPEAIRPAITALGYKTSGEQDLYDALVHIYKTGGTDTLKKILNETPYKNNAPNDTAGYSKFFMSKSPPGSQPKNARSIWDGVLAGLGAGLVTFGTMDAGSSGGGGNTQTAAQKAAADKAASDAAAAQKKKTTTMWLIIGGVVVVVVILFVFFTGKKKPAAA